MRCPRTLVYKRTHRGDPRRDGVFGIEDCMGRVRRLHFDAVIGIGGIGGEPISQGIAGKINWIGIGARTEPSHGMRGPLVTFDHFILFEENGREFEKIAPALARRLYTRGAPRFVFRNLNATEHAEIRRILKLAENAPPSAGSGRRRLASRRCGRRRCRPKC
jgi:hypothetical protein